MKQYKKILMTLVALLALTTGAWAQEQLITIADGDYYQVAMPCNFIWAFNENQMILTADEIGCKGQITSVAYKRHSDGSGDPTSRNIDIYMVHTTKDAYGSTAEWIPVTSADLVYSGEFTFQTAGEDWQTITLDTPFEYNGTDNLCICIDDNTGSTTSRMYWSAHYTSNISRSIRAFGSVDFDPTLSGSPAGGSTLTGNFVADIQLGITTVPGEMTLNAAKTVATMEMPGNDVTIEYEIVRDMSEQMTTKVGNAADGADYRIRLRKDGSKWELADIGLDALKALISVHDVIENENLACFGQDAVCTLQIFAIDDNDQPTGDAISFANLEPGRYKAKAVAKADGDYIGETALSNVIVLFQGYEVTVPAKEYITYYKDENLKLDTEETDAKIYTITEVNGAEATATQLAIAPMNVPILVYNNSEETKTILLIPTDDQADDVTAYLGFVGTLEATTIAASTNSQNNYAMNGKEFIWVRTAIPVAANKAWLAVPVSSGNSANIRIVFDNDEATEIEGVDSGELTVDSDDAWYDLSGRKLDGQPTTKGVYIWKGKKVVVK